MTRRIVLAAAGAAMLAPASAETAAETKVVIDLGGLSLPPEIARRMETDLRRAVLMAVAKAYPKTRFKSLPLPAGTYGIVLARA